jgi:class 3 adenylate cyclase
MSKRQSPSGRRVTGAKHLQIAGLRHRIKREMSKLQGTSCLATISLSLRDGTSLHRYPGTSCLATISLSLRDKIEPARSGAAKRGAIIPLGCSIFPLVTAADFRTLVLVAAGELQLIAIERRAKVEEFQRKHRTGLLTLLFTDIVDSTKLKQTLGDREAVPVIQRHHAVIREILGQFSEGEEIETAGDCFFIVFTKPSDAVKFSLLVQARLRALSAEVGRLVFDRIGIHVGEVWIEEHDGAGKAQDLYGLQVDTCARVQSLGQADQILLSRFPFDAARQALKGEELHRIGTLSWLNHGPYRMKGVEDPLEICEVGEEGKARLRQPPDSEKAYRFMSADSEPVLGWRPAIDQAAPGTGWVLERKLGEGGFGEVWLGRDKRLKTERVFKFCFRADRVRSLKREAVPNCS